MPSGKHDEIDDIERRDADKQKEVDDLMRRRRAEEKRNGG
jgi:hypothetical protein